MHLHFTYKILSEFFKITNLLILLVPQGGFEPPTCPLGGDRSILLSYRGVEVFYHKPQHFMFSIYYLHH